MKYSEIVDITLEEVKEKLDMERESYFKMKLNHVVSPIENPQVLSETRKNIARLLTELKKRELTAASK